MSTTSPTEHLTGSDNPAERAERFVDRHQRTIEVFTRLGWIAKGVVYTLFGVTAIAIAQQSAPSDSAPSDEASPQGALGKLMDAPAGRLMIGVMAVGLILYCLWRVFSVVLVDGSDLEAWGDRIGYSFSAVFYAVLGYTAAQSAWSGVEPGDSSTVESLSRSLLENTVGRWLLGIGGAITIAVGLYFAVRKGAMRGFADDVRGVSRDGAAGGVDRAIWIGGIVGWIGRGVVTVLVGWFVLRSAITFDPDEARGFDRALREAATSTVGTVLVWITGIGLIAYGAFCLLSHRRRTLTDT
jgi:succinate dehydrogenase hydrophobic anchor subunit